MNLAGLLAEDEPDAVAILAESGGSSSVAELLAAAPCAGLDLGCAVLDSPDAPAAARALVALDGRARRLVLSGGAHLPVVATLRIEDEAPARPDPGAPRPEETEWVFATSGTTGEPKLVVHRLASLLRLSRPPRPGPRPRWGLLYEWSRFAGVQVVLQALAGRGTLVCPDRGRALAAQVEFLAESGCDHLSATPTLWRNVLMAPAARELPLRQVTLGGEIADQRILDGLQAAFPGARVTHIFASTEAGAAFAVSDGREGFPVGYLDDPPSGVGLRVEDGRLLVANPDVEPAYLGGGAFAEGGWVDTGDAVELRGDRYVFLGRRSGVINVGGAKLHPEELEGFLARHPAVAQVHVHAQPSSILGSLVVAEVVPEPAAPAEGLSRTLIDYCRAQLPRHMVPGKVRIVDSLPLNAAGKLERS